VTELKVLVISFQSLQTIVLIWQGGFAFPTVRVRLAFVTFTDHMTIDRVAG